LRCDKDDPRIKEIVTFFINYDFHKSHGRSLDRIRVREQLGTNVVNVEETGGLAALVRSLYNQFEFWFDRTPSYKVFENAYGINWGRNLQEVTLQVPYMISPGMPKPAPQPGQPERSE